MNEGLHYYISNLTDKYDIKTCEERWWHSVETQMDWESFQDNARSVPMSGCVSELKLLKTTMTKEGLNHFVFEVRD